MPGWRLGLFAIAVINAPQKQPQVSYLPCLRLLYYMLGELANQLLPDSLLPILLQKAEVTGACTSRGHVCGGQ